jgi:scyllo-inositol 2-dehydrogenase (NADP+)
MKTTMTGQIRVGLIGYGIAGQVFHAPIINAVPQLQLTTVVERHGELARQRYPWIETVKTAEELLSDPKIDLVVIATPNTSHFDLAQKALMAGKHVVVDKPFTTTSEQAQRLIDLADRQQKRISVHHNRRWDGDFQTVQRLLATGHLGQLVEYEAHYDRFRTLPKPAAWREQEDPGSGLLFDLGSHLIDQAQVLFGLPEAITADIRVQRPQGKAVDYFEVVFHYRQLKAILKGGMLVRELGPHFILHGTQGSFVKYGMDPQEAALREGQAPPQPNWGREPETQWGTLNTQISDLHFQGKIETIAGCYQAYYENVADAIAQGAELAVEPQAARDTIRLIELALQSHQQQRTVAYQA